MIKKLTFAFVLTLFSTNLHAGGLEGYFNVWKRNVAETWNNPEHFDIYVPLNTWHNRWTYDQENLDRYNEQPWGLGLGTSRYDEYGNWHALYFMGFKDSNYHLQTIFGYAYQKNWYWGCLDEWRAGIGFTTSLTQRNEYAMIPLPLPLPLAGIGYKRFNIQAAYVPGTRNNGNVLFTWARMEF